jgi:pyridoxamine 5'-phosphate oxidase
MAQEEILLTLPTDPLVGFKEWFDKALSANCPEPTAMTLASVSVDGTPSARIVLFKGLIDNAFFFVTNYQSRKAQELLSNPRVSLVFFWSPLQRQIRITGVAEKASEKQSDEYFNSRPRGSQIGSWSSPQSSVIKDREELIEKVKEIEEKFKNKAVTRPPFWGGFLIRPEKIEFWEGRESRLHERFLFEKKNNAWVKSRLAP